MGANATDITALQQYAEKFGKGLLKIAVTDNEVFRKMDVVAGIKDKFTMTTLRFQRLLRPYKRDWDPATDKVKLVPRTLRVEIGEIMLEEEPLAYRKSYLGHIMKSGVNPKDHPFEKDFLEGISRQAASDFNDITAFFGVRNAVGTGPADVNDGFYTILDAEIALGTISLAKKNMINTGAIDSTNAVAKLKAFYRAACAINPALRNKKITLKISHEVLEAYNDNYKDENGSLPYNKQFDQTFLEGSSNNCILDPYTGMGTSKRIILTPDWNMSVGTDLESDQESVSVTTGINPKVVGFYLAAAYGVQIWTLDTVFFTNEPGVDD